MGDMGVYPSSQAPRAFRSGRVDEQNVRGCSGLGERPVHGRVAGGLLLQGSLASGTAWSPDAPCGGLPVVASPRCFGLRGWFWQPRPVTATVTSSPLRSSPASLPELPAALPTRPCTPHFNQSMTSRNGVRPCSVPPYAPSVVPRSFGVRFQVQEPGAGPVPGPPGHPTLPPALVTCSLVGLSPPRLQGLA